jgi:hypothetical protein
LVPPFTVPYDYRYILPALPLLCVAVPLSLIVLVERVRRVPETTPSSVRGGVAAYIDSP